MRAAIIISFFLIGCKSQFSFIYLESNYIVSSTLGESGIENISYWVFTPDSVVFNSKIFHVKAWSQNGEHDYRFTIANRNNEVIDLRLDENIIRHYTVGKMDSLVQYQNFKNVNIK